MKVFSRTTGDDAGERASQPENSAESRFERVVAAYGSFLRSAIQRYCPAEMRSSIGDIEQEAKIKLWRALESEKEIENPASYVYRIAATTTIDAIRRVRSRRDDQLRLAGEEPDVPATKIPPSAAPSPESVAEQRQLAGKIQEAVTRLADNRRRAVKLHLQGLSFQEVARLLGWTDGKARNLIYRGLDDLRAELENMGIESGTH